MNGTLYVVATPIGNLEDFSKRGRRILAAVDRILAEDTRVTRRLCRHFEIATPIESFHEGNEDRKTARVLERMEEGLSFALVSDAGTPLVSDPGFLLVREVRSAGLEIVPVPGPSAAIAALSVSGLPMDRFAFLGFVPRKAGKARNWFEAAPDETLVVYETPHRIRRTLAILADLWPNRDIALLRELTKVHEEYLGGTAKEILDALEPEKDRGEFVLVIGRAKRRKSADRADSQA